MTKTLKRIAPLQAGKMLGLLYGLFSLIFVPFFLLFTVLGAVLPASTHQQGMPFAGIGIIAGLFLMIFIPLLYAVLGFVFGIIGAWIYNLVAKWIGGLQFDVE